MKHPREIRDLDPYDQQAFFDSINPDWLSQLEMTGSEYAGLNDLLDEYASAPESYEVGSLLRTFNGNFSESRADDLDFGEGWELTKRELTMLRAALERKCELDEVECDTRYFFSFEFQHQQSTYTAEFSGPMGPGGFEWELESITPKLSSI